MMARTPFYLVFVLLLTSAGAAWAQDWQVRSICDMRRVGLDRACRCISVASELVMLLADKAGPENVAVVADFVDNLQKTRVSWESPCPDAQRCPDSAYTIRYAFVPKNMAVVSRHRTFSVTVCRDDGQGAPAPACVCRKTLLSTLQELTERARKEGAMLAVLDCTGQDEDQSGEGLSQAIELTYAFVDEPRGAPIAGDDPVRAAGEAASDLFAVSPGAPALARTGERSRSQRDLDESGARPGSPPPSSPPPPGGRIVVMQVAALPNVVQAETLADRLRAQGVEAFFERAEVNGREFYWVLAKSSAPPQEFKRRLAALGFPSAVERR